MKREEKRLENKRKAEEEVLYLQETGKIKTKPARLGVKPKQQSSKMKAKDMNAQDSESEVTLTQRSIQSSQMNPRDTERSERTNEVTIFPPSSVFMSAEALVSIC